MTLLQERATGREQEARRALDVVMDPELDEPVTDLGFVRSLAVEATPEGTTVVCHLRLPTSFCSPSFAYLMASDAKDALGGLAWADRVVVALDDHHDSDLINAGLAADAGYLGTFGDEAEDSLDELRTTFRRKAHTAAMERCLTALLRADPDRAVESLGEVTLADLVDVLGDDASTAALRRRRAALDLPEDARALVMVDHRGLGYPASEVPMRLRRARSTRISIDGNAHFCRGLLATRYPGAEADQSTREEETFVPLASLSASLTATTHPSPEEESAR